MMISESHRCRLAAPAAMAKHRRMSFAWSLSISLSALRLLSVGGHFSVFLSSSFFCREGINTKYHGATVNILSATSTHYLYMLGLCSFVTLICIVHARCVVSCCCRRRQSIFSVCVNQAATNFCVLCVKQQKPAYCCCLAVQCKYVGKIHNTHTHTQKIVGVWGVMRARFVGGLSVDSGGCFAFCVENNTWKLSGLFKTSYTLGGLAGARVHMCTWWLVYVLY